MKQTVFLIGHDIVGDDFIMDKVFSQMYDALVWGRKLLKTNPDYSVYLYKQDEFDDHISYIRQLQDQPTEVPKERDLAFDWDAFEESNWTWDKVLKSNYTEVIVRSYGYTEKDSLTSHFEPFKEMRTFVFTINRDYDILVHKWLTIYDYDDLDFHEEDGKLYLEDPDLYARP